MRDWWIKLGCFLTGYNYKIVKNCSEASAKHIKKVTSALIIIMIIWGFIGYTFSSIYLCQNDEESSTLFSVCAAIVMIVIILQIERQIILNIGINNKIVVFRTIIAVIMAILGSVIIDQIIFKVDIENKKQEHIIDKVDKLLDSKVKEYNEKIAEIDSSIFKINKEIKECQIDVDKKPEIKSTSWVTKKVPRQVKKTVIVNDIEKEILVDTLLYERTYSTIKKPNPKYKRIEDLENQIQSFREDKDIIYENKINVRKDLEKEFLEKSAFLDELIIMKKLLWPFNVATFVWILWFGFFVCIELFVLMCKGKEKTDYDEIIEHQRDTKKFQLKKLGQKNDETNITRTDRS